MIIAGKGPDLPRLRARAGSTVTLRGYVSDEELLRLYGTSRALLFPQIEDAGIVPLEAMASGLPVIAYNRGGIRDVILDGETGVMADEQTVEAFEVALLRFNGVQWNHEHIRKHAQRFHVDTFKEKIMTAINS